MHMRDVVPSMARDLEDSQKLMLELNKASEVFSPDDRKEIGEIVAHHMQASSETKEGKGTKMQKNKYLQHYMSDTLWKKFQDPSIDWDTKKEEGADFLIMIRCLHPDDETYKLLLAILAECHSKRLTPTDAYNEIKNLKEKMTNKRPLSNATPALAAYPKDVSEFMRRFNDVYPQCDPPVASKIEANKLQQAMRKDKMPTRNTNSAYDNNAVGRNATSSGSQYEQHAQQDFMMRMMCGYMMGNNPNFNADGNRGASRDRRRETPALKDSPRNPTLAITDGSVNDKEAPTATDSTATGAASSKFDAISVLERTKAAMLAKKNADAAGKKTQGQGKGKKRPIDDMSSADEDEEGVEEESEEEEGDRPIVSKRPAAKNPNAKVDKKPASCSEGLDAKPKPTTKPTAYNGGRIYFKKGKNIFRVYKRSGDKIESTVTGADPKKKTDFAKAWKLSLKYIDDDTRPR